MKDLAMERTEELRAEAVELAEAQMNFDKVAEIWAELQYISDVPETVKDFDEFIHDKMDSVMLTSTLEKYMIDGVVDFQLAEAELGYLWTKFINSFESDPYAVARGEQE